jgi:hypothetical protein
MKNEADPQVTLTFMTTECLPSEDRLVLRDLMLDLLSKNKGSLKGRAAEVVGKVLHPQW